MDDSNSPVDMDVSYDCELNLSTDFEPNSFKEAASHVNGNKQCKRSMMPS